MLVYKLSSFEDTIHRLRITVYGCGVPVQCLGDKELSKHGWRNVGMNEHIDYTVIHIGGSARTIHLICFCCLLRSLALLHLAPLATMSQVMLMLIRRVRNWVVCHLDEVAGCP